MKKILVINTSGLGVGGITTHMSNYISMTKDDYEYTIVSTIYNNESVISSFENMGCTVVKVPNRKNHLWCYWRYINKMMKENRYDVVHVHGNSSTMLIELLTARIHSIETRIAHSHNSVCSHKVLHKVLNPLFKHSYNIAVACSEVAGNWIFGARNFYVLRNGIDTEKYKFNLEARKNYRKLFDVDDDTILFGNVGNIVEQKNQIFLLPLIKELRKYYPLKLVVIGEGDNEEILRQEIINNGLEDIVSIFSFRNDINNCFQAFDCFLLPSRWEGLPMVLVEAQAAGLPCYVSTAVTKEAIIISNLFRRLKLEENIWIENLKNVKMNDIREIAFNQVVHNGYDMKECAKLLRRMYG